MWPFRKKKKKKRSKLDKMIAWIVIGGAVGSIVGKRSIDRMREDEARE